MKISLVIPVEELISLRIVGGSTKEGIKIVME